MHEWALAESVIKTIKENPAFKKTKHVNILFGELQNIEKEIFMFAMKELSKQDVLVSKIRYKIVNVKAEFKCKKCGNEFGLKDLKDIGEEEKENIHFIPEMVNSFVKCPKCKSPDFEIIEGRGISLQIEG
jgi:hydrogenase nickel incorporation protein HypA/HybF